MATGTLRLDVIELMDARGDDPELAPLIGHLRAATPADRPGRPGPLRRYAAARHIADLFDHYAVHRPDLLRSWAAGAPLPAVRMPRPPGRPTCGGCCDPGCRCPARPSASPTPPAG